MKKIAPFLIAFVLTIGSSGCATVNLNAEGYDKAASLTTSEKPFTIVKHFKKEMKAWFALFSLVTLSEPDIAKVLRDETASSKGDAVINLKVQGQTTFVDGAIPIVLGGIGAFIVRPAGVVAGYFIAARTYTIEGDVIQYGK
ncbi:MAG: hypothetical protein NTV54_00765 [Ignavibacteriales bacterium]|nr:hypothetical protein [Ignavibacteriales bacterium]